MRGAGSIPVAILLIGSILTISTTADDWPQWRNVDRQNISHDPQLRTSWPAEGPDQTWLFKNCGIGYSGPSILGDRLFIMGARENGEQLICVRASDGQEIWSTDVGDTLENGWGDGPRSTPTIDGDHVFALGGQGHLVCVRIEDGAERWRTQLQEYGGSIPNWGYCESVLVDGEQLICTPGGEQGTLLALNKTDGSTIWQSSGVKDKAQYASPIVAVHNDIRQYIQLTQESVVSVRSDTGEVLWRADWPGRVAVVPTPIFHNGYVYVTSGYGVGCNLFKIDSENRVEGIYDSDARKVMKNHHGGVLLMDGYVYGHSDGGGWVCQDFLTGEAVWRERSNLGKGAVCGGNGMLYCLSEDEGHVALVKASPEGWEEFGRFTLEPQSTRRKPRGRIWTHPVIANGKLFLRDQDLLYCYDITQTDNPRP